MAASMRALAEALDVPLGIVLEGGYALGALSRSVVATLEAAGDTSAAAPDVPEHPLSVAARERLARHWPSLA
jgi:acetoin utilization deacetylase AcuC-like enzyme